MSNNNTNNNNNNNKKTDYISFPTVYDTEARRKSLKTTPIETSNDNSKKQEILIMKNDLINIYSSKKYAKWFQIIETKTHENGNYTIYKIAYRFIPSDISDKVKELIVWKRFNDFKELYKILSKYHGSLHRRQVFPEFIKPNFFGRFDQKIIEERKEYILKLLQFCATQPHLYLHEKFIEFFSIGNLQDHEILNENDQSGILEPSSKVKSRIADDIEEQQQQQQQSSNKINIENIYSELSNLLLQSTGSSPTTTSSSPNGSNISDYDYIKKSLQYIQEGLFNEKQESYNSAFELYKLAVAILIKGIQKETQQTVIKIIQEKTQQLLLKAEMIFETKLNPAIVNNSNDTSNIHELSFDNDASEQNRWIVIENFCQLSFEIEPNLSNSHGSMLELNENFKIIKILENNCYLMRNKIKTNSNNGDFYYYVLKCLPKTSSNQISNRKSILPKTQNKYLTKFYKYYENEFSIFLLLEYKKYGKLYDYIKFKANDTNTKVLIAQSINSNTNQQLLIDDPKKLKQISSFTCNLNVNYYHEELKFNNTEQQLSPPKHLFQISHDSPSSKSGDDDENLSYNLNTTDLVKKLNVLTLNTENKKLFLAQIACALESLHSIGILCKDLKSKNILLDDDQNSICLTYFSQWCLVDEVIDKMAIEQMYVAPEFDSILSNNQINESCDCWSYGVICYELLTLNKFSDLHSKSAFSNDIVFPENFDETSADLIRQLIQINPKNRLTLDKLKLHQFFNSINWSQIQK